MTLVTFHQVCWNPLLGNLVILLLKNKKRMRKIEWHYIKSYKLYFMVDLNIEPYGGTNALHY